MVEHSIFSVRLPKAMVDEVDGIFEVTGHTNRNDFIRSAVRVYLNVLYEREAIKKEAVATLQTGEKTDIGVSRP